MKMEVIMHKIGFIGAGNMGGALIIAACKTIGGENVIITDYNLDKAKELAASVGCDVAESNIDVVKNAEYFFFAVKPNVIRDVAREIAPALNEDVANGVKHVVVTIAAGITIDTIKECVSDKAPIIRIMPNTPVAVGQGMILLTGLTEDDANIKEFREIMAKAGDFLYIPEKNFDITTSISGCTPAYAYMFISALADGAVQVGVPRDQAIQLAAKTVLGSAQMVLETGIHPDKLKDNVCSPGGSTIVGVNALERNNFRYAVAQSIIESTNKNLELGK